MRTRQAEILAPAGSPEALQAALDAGADAVYLGLKAFNARGNAINFSPQDLAHYVPLAHANDTKVYLTLNTLVKMEERAGILSALQDASDCGIDGVIIQDLGLADVIATRFPKLRRHASTQMAIHNLDGVRFCVERGIHRVVLARELTFQEIREIRDAFPPDVIELEVFCHGAMCYTYSGMCFFSGSVGGRSGNRGECAYTCRKGYRILNDTTFPRAAAAGSFKNYLFSMKDMNTLDVLDELLATGVDSLKIEGRRKGPAYVGASVRAYRDRMQGVDGTARERDLKLAFARDYTRAFYQRGQFGDAPIDIRATGTQGLLIGIMAADSTFELLEPGLQRYDGLRLVLPNRDETSLSFRDYTVLNGDRNRPEKGARIQLKGNYPLGTEVRWIRSQSVERRYQPKRGQGPKAGENFTPPLPVNLHVRLSDEKLHVTMACRDGQISGSLPVEPSKSGRPTLIRDVLYRFGDVALVPEAYVGPDEVDGFIPKSHLKQLRRHLLGELESLVSKRRQQALTLSSPPSMIQSSAQTSPSYIVRTDCADRLPELLAWAEAAGHAVDFTMRPTLSTPAWRQAYEHLQSFSGLVRLVLPMVIRRWDMRVLRARLPKPGALPFDVVVSNPGHLPMMREYARAGNRLHADFSLYQLNDWAYTAFRRWGVDGRFTLSLEDDWPNMQALLQTVDANQCEVIAYTDTPLFVAEACSLAALYGGCPGAKVCGHETLQIENDHGDRFEVRHDRCRSTVVGKDALSWSGRLRRFVDLGVRYFRVDFTVRDYDLSAIKHIMAHITHDRPLPGTHAENLERVLL